MSTIYYRLQTLTTTIPSFSYSRHHQHPLDYFIFKKSRMDDSCQVFFDHNAWPGHSAGLEKSCHFACHSQVLTLREFRLLFPCRSSGFRSFNGTHNLMNERLQIFRFDHGGNATEHLQCRNLLTPNLLWLFQAWCH